MINSISTALLGFVFFYFYSRFEKQIYILLGVIFIILGIIQGYWAYEEHQQFLIPTYSTLEGEFNENAIELSEEKTLNSIDGYSILLPKEFSYFDYPSGTYLLLAKNRLRNLDISVSRIQMDNETVNRINNGDYLHLNDSSNSLILSERVDYQKNGTNIHLLGFEVRENFGTSKGFIAIFEYSEIEAFQLVMSGLKNDFNSNKALFKRVLDSFSVTK